jgi:pullulanase/glycogen debranching enzyme
MQGADWSNPDARAVTVAGTGGALLINAWWEPLTFVLPADGAWTVELDTAQPADGRQASSAIEVVARSLVLLSAPR